MSCTSVVDEQLEGKVQVRRVLPRPEQGALPLPKQLDAQWFDRMPSSVEDLNSIASGPVPLSTPQDHPQVSHPFRTVLAATVSTWLVCGFSSHAGYSVSDLI